MVTLLSERHRANFSRLDHNESVLVWSKCRERWPDLVGSEPDPEDDLETLDGDCVFDLAQSCGLDQAKVVLSLANLNGAARPIIEKLIGREIRPWGATVEAEQAAAEASGTRHPWRGSRVAANGAKAPAPIAAPARNDRRVVLTIAPNPHVPGSDMHTSYKAWAVGDTVQQCRNRGLTARGLRRNTRRGFVVLGPPEKI